MDDERGKARLGVEPWSRQECTSLVNLGEGVHVRGLGAGSTVSIN